MSERPAHRPVVPSAAPPAPWRSDESVWQLVESGSYRIDLAAWNRIAATATGTVVDLGCGIGRVARNLARAGHRVIGVERSPGIAADFERRAAGLDAEVVVADALACDQVLPGAGSFGLVLAPQQLLQIVGGPVQRQRLVATTRNLLRDGGRAAFAITFELPEFSAEIAIAPDRRELAGWLYSSCPVSVEARSEAIELTRVRERTSPSGQTVSSTLVTGFARLDPGRLAADLLAEGLVPESSIPLPATSRHVSSVIVVARRAA